MLYYKFKNYEEFQEIFGMTSHGNGVKSRKNKILLDYIKDKDLLRQAIKTNDFSLLHISTMAELKETMMRKLHNSGARTTDCKYTLQLLNYKLYSPIYETDENKGLCEDGTPNFVRYYNHERQKIFKMKPGRLMNYLIESCPFGKTLEGKAVKNWLCEEFATDWEAYTMSMIPKNTLHVDDNFEDIYSSKRMMRDGHECDPFNSCMTDKNHWKFYEYAVSAKAAYLTNNETGLIIARCIIFIDVKDETGKKWRMAERQYSYHQNLVYQRALIDALIQGDYIDCYKKTGAGCCDANAIVDIHGNDLSEKRFEIDCDLEYDDPLSYQDSFKWYYMHQRKAYNYEPEYYDYELDVTEGSLEANFEGHDDDDENYDEYHEEYTYRDLVDVHYQGSEYTCSEDRLDDFERYKNEWYHTDDLTTCPHCGERMLNEEYYKDQLFYSELLGGYYCGTDCRDTAEYEWKREHWFYAQYDDEYFEHEEEITTFITLNTKTGLFEQQTISVSYLQELVESKEMVQIGETYYETKLAAS